ncbi:titin isoform X2 [Atheta coriaria]|uniref:titin isoform X2 n=1 Tax=Dalotia coriaria TaxID=877792 RepID=UPI0031F39C04
MDAPGANKQVSDKPPVPIKTYQWEDIRRARRKGGYPWTYLDKRPFDDNFIDDFKIRTDPNLRKAKSSVSMNRHSANIEKVTHVAEQSPEKEMETDENKENIMVESNDSSADVSISQYLDKEERETSSEELLEMEELAKMHQERVKGLTIGEEYEYWSKLQKGEIPNVLGSEWPIPNLCLKAPSRASSKEVLDSPGSSKDAEKSETLRSQRAKSEEPGRKRKHSIESSYSRVSKYSLSPQGIMKKIKEAKEKIKSSKFFSKSESKLTKKPKTEQSIVVEKKEKKDTIKPKKVEGPLYIHIPLKPPPGETDEFSHLEFEDQGTTARKVSPIAEEKKESADEAPETPTETGSGVQLIILTAPSDDEILDTPAVPETPSEPENGFFETKRMDELKKIATDVVDKYSPETKRKTFTSVKEEEEEDQGKKAAVVEEKEVKKVEEPVIVEKPPVAPSEDTGVKKKKKKVVKKDKSKDKPKEEEKLIETQKTDDDKIQEQKEQKTIPATKLSIDEEDGLKTEMVIAQIIDDDVKESDLSEKGQSKEKVKESPLLKKKVSFKRRSKEDSDGIYEDVLVTSEPVQKEEKTPSSPTPRTPTPSQLHDEKIAKMHEERTKGMTVAEEYQYWSKLQKGEIPFDYDLEPTPPPQPVKVPASPSPTTPTTPTTPKTPTTPTTPIKTTTPHPLDDERIAKIHEERAKGMTPSEEYAYWKKVQRGEIIIELPPEDEEERPPSFTPTTTPSPSVVPDMHLDEQATKMHQENIKGMSVAEEYEYWSRVNCHDYEPVIPPDDNFRPIEVPSADGRPKKPSTPITDSDIEYLAARAADIELRTTKITITNKEDPAEALVVPLESALKEETKSTKSEVKEDGHGKKIQDAFQKQATNLKRQASIVSKKASEQAEKIQTRVKSIKKPKMPKPKFEKPNLPKLKIEKPHMPHFKIEKPKMPKIPDRMKNISLSLPRKGKRSARQPTSTESTAGDSEKRTVFDFSTYPRIFRKKKRDDDGDNIHTPRTGTDVTPVSERTTLPRFKFTTRWKGKFTKQPPPSSVTNDTINSYKSKDSERSETQGSVRIPLHSEGSMDRESLDLRTNEEREDSVERRMRLAASSRYDDDIDMNDAYMKENQEIHRASSFNAKFNDRWNHGKFHADEPPEQMVTDLDDEEKPPTSILKKKIENIHAGSSDDVRRRGVLEEINSDEFFLRQKGISQDNIEVGAYLSSEIREAFRTPNNALSQLEKPEPEAPKRRPFKKPKRKKTPHVSQEGIQYDQDSIHTEPDVSTYQTDDFETDVQPERPKRRGRKKDDEADMKYIEDQILSRDEFMDEQQFSHYENEHMEGIEQPNIILSSSYHAEHFYPDDDVPAAPPRKHKSLRSLNAMSEHDSITEELNGYKEVQQEVSQYEHEYQIPTPDQPPKRPFRTRSRTRSRSRGTALPDEETVARELLQSTSQQSLTYKSHIRDPPLPPCRRRSLKSEGAEEERFFTAPRPTTQREPVRPLRNYSTLGPSRPPRKRSVPNLTDEEKHIGDPYIEIEDDDHAGKNLHSGEVIQKMKGRPLPAPPRPPRKVRDSSRGSRKSERSEDRSYDDMGSRELHDVETSVQTEPLPDDFECEALVRDPNDRIITPTVDKYAEISRPKAVREFEHQETITHGSLLVQPFAHGEEIPTGPIEMYSRNTERIVTVKREADSNKDIDYDETSEIPEEFTKLKSPTPQPQPPQPPPVQQVIERIIEKHIPIQMEPPGEVETLKAQKLQVADLDVERLAVGELHANKIKVGDIEGTSISVNEINSNSVGRKTPGTS